MLCSLESKLVFDSTGVRSTKPQRTSRVASDGMGQANNNNIVSGEYHAAVSAEFDRDGMGQTNNNNIVSGEHHAAVSVEFDGNGMGQTTNNNIISEEDDLDLSDLEATMSSHSTAFLPYRYTRLPCAAHKVGLESPETPLYFIFLIRST